MEVFPVLLQELTDESLDTTASGAVSKKVLSSLSGGKQNNPKVEGIKRGVITGASVNSNAEKLTETAKEFEAIFTAQLLSMMRDTASQTDFLGSNSTSMKIFNSMKYLFLIRRTNIPFENVTYSSNMNVYKQFI